MQVAFCPKLRTQKRSAQTKKGRVLLDATHASNGVSIHPLWPAKSPLARNKAFPRVGTANATKGTRTDRHGQLSENAAGRTHKQSSRKIRSNGQLDPSSATSIIFDRKGKRKSNKNPIACRSKIDSSWEKEVKKQRRLNLSWSKRSLSDSAKVKTNSKVQIEFPITESKAGCNHSRGLI